MTSGRQRDRPRTRRGRVAGRRPTIADVARLAGVSSATVSFVVNGRDDERISPETKQRVLGAVEALGYRPNRAAQALRTRRTRTIGFVTDEIAVKAPAGHAISGVHDVAREHGSMLLIVHATRDRGLLARAIEDLLDRQVDAIVYAAVGTEASSLPNVARHVPFVLVNCFVADGDVPSIVPDEEAGGRAATGVVVAAGHRRIAFIAGDDRAWATGRRVAGYRSALAAAGITVDDEPILYGNFRADSGYELTRAVISRRERPTAILCGNDLMAVGAYFAVKEMGMRVPEDVSVMGYDDQEDLAADLSPPLSTVRLPFYEMGRWAAEHIVAASVDELPPMTYAKCPVVERASIATPAVGVG